MNRLLSVAVLGSALILGSCDEASAPAGRDGVVTVRAYVDRDDSGTLTEGDSLIDGFQAALVRDGEEVTTVTTNDGVGVSEPLEPGSYEVSIVGGEPVGAALLTNPQPTVAVNVRGDSVRVDFRYTFFPGSVVGRLFIDNGTTPGVFDAGDEPGAGLFVLLRANNNGVPGDVIDSVVTGAQGTYAFARVAPGTYFLQFEKSGDFNYGEATEFRQITVTGQQTTAQDATFTGSLLIPIQTARARTSGTVLVRGNVTARPGSFTSGTNGVNSEIWIQDATGGIAVFSVLSADSLRYAIGDLLEVRGPRSSFSGQEQISGTGLTVTELAGSTIRPAKAVTGTQFNSLADEGQLVVIDSVRITAVPTGTGANFTVLGTARDGQTVAIRVHGPTATQTNTGLTRADFIVGNYYRVTGILTENVFNNVSTPQIKPRSRADLVDRTAVVPPPQPPVRFSEIHYDNTGTDAGESIEIAGPAGTDLTGWQVVLYNGNGGVTYGTPTVLSGPLPATCGARGVVVITYAVNGLQNGGTATLPEPDGFALINAAGAVVEFLSYEGTITATNGPATGMTSTNIGVLEPGTDPVGLSLQRIANGTWTGPIANTFGACNDI